MGRLTAGAEVGRLRISGARAGAPGPTAGLGLAIGQADLRPHELAPAAILVIRRLADPLPGRAVARPGAAAAAEWERTTRDAIGDHARRAARPAAGPVAEEAAAVLFADPAELVACLLADLAAGRAATRWWWRLLLRRLAPSSRPAELMLAEPEALPAALLILARRGDAAAVVAGLTSRETAEVAEAIARAHLATAITLGAPVATVPGRRRPAAARAHSPLPGPSDGREPSAPWNRWLPAGIVPPYLAPDQQLLLASALLLAIRAAVVRSAAYRAAVVRWRASEPEGPGRLPPRRTDPQPWAGLALPPGSEPGEPRPSPPAGVAAGRPARERPAPAPPSATAAAPEPSGEPQPTGTAPARPARERQVSARSGPTRLRPDIADEPPGTVRGPEPLGDGGDPASGSDGVESGLCGVLYLVNLIEHLRLPDCFVDLALSPWGLVEAAGRGLAGLEPRWAVDPVWPLLAGLDGRPPGELPAVPAGTAGYRIPGAWWEPFAGGAAGTPWGGRGGIVRTWTGHGFLLTEEEAPAARAAAAAALGAFGRRPGRRAAFAAAPLDPLAGPAMAGAGAGLRWWLARIVPYLRARLAAELAVPPAAVAAELLERRGRVYATRTHVDVVLPLDAASLPVRRAGLDRNPGWVARFGRVVTFHFE